MSMSAGSDSVGRVKEKISTAILAMALATFLDQDQKHQKEIGSKKWWSLGKIWPAEIHRSLGTQEWLKDQLNRLTHPPYPKAMKISMERGIKMAA